MARPILTLLLLLGAAAPAWAQDDPYLAKVQAAKAALKAKDWSAARARLAEAEPLAPQASVLVPADDAAAVPFLRGVLEWGQDRQDAAFDEWREAIAMVPTYQPDKTVLPDPAAQDAFYALVGEVRQRPELALGVPEDLLDGAIFVDGTKREAGETVLEGRHLVQVRCPEGGVKGSWHSFGVAPPDYFVLCSGGSYPVDKNAKKPKKDKPPKPKKEEPKKEEPKKEAAKREASAAPKAAAPARATPPESAAATKPAAPAAPKAASAASAAPARPASSTRTLAFNLTGGALLAGAAGSAVYTWSSWGTVQDAVESWQKKGESEDYEEARVRPAYSTFYTAAGLTGGLLVGGTTFILLGAEPTFAPVAGGGMLSWSGSF